MKMWLLVFFIAAGSVFGEVAAPFSQEEAVKQFPQLKDADSAFNRRYLARLKSLRAGDDPLLKSGDWPLIVAQEIGMELGIGPILPKAADTVPVTKKEAWKPKTNALGQSGNTSLASPAAEGNIKLQGAVLQSTPEGCLILTPPKDGEERVWLNEADYKVGAKINIVATRDGVHEYATGSGLIRKLKAYRPAF